MNRAASPFPVREHLATAASIFLLLASGAAAGGPKGACMSISVSRPGVLVGSGQTVQLSVDVKGRRSTTPRLRANKGKISELLASGPNSFVATYTPPWKPEPDLAIIWAESPDSGCAPAFAVVTLLAEKTVSARVAPNARASLKIGSKTFGPVRADAQGWVEFKARLHPAHAWGTLEVALPGGKNKRQKIQLDVKPRARLTVLVSPRVLRADGLARSRIHLFACTPAGRPIPRASFRIGAESGKASRVVALGNGIFRTFFQPQRLVTAKRIRMRVEMLKPRKMRRSIELRLLPGIDLDIQLSSSVPGLLTDGESRAVITAVVRDEAGRGMEKLPLEITTTAGRMGPVSELGDGRYQAELVGPVGEKGAAVVKAALGKQFGRLSLPLSPPEPLVLESDKTELIADGADSAQIVVRVYPPKGSSAAAGLAVQAFGGTAPGRVALKNNRAAFAFKAGPRAGPARVRVIMGELSQTIDLSLVPGKPARLELAASRDELVTDGSQSVRIVARISDRSGNPIPKPNLAFTASRGRIEPTRVEGPGELVTGYLPPEDAEGEAVIRAAGYENLSSEIRIALQPPPRRFGLSVTAGLEHNLRRIGAPLVSVEGGYRLFDGLFVTAGIGYFYSAFEAACPDGPEGCGADLRLDAIPFWVGLDYRFENGSLFTPNITVGATGVWSRLAIESDYQTRQVHSSVAPGGFARAGLDMELGPGGILLQLGYQYARWLGDQAVTGQLGGLSARLGYRFAF